MYSRRIPEKTLLYQTIQENFETFAERFEKRSGGNLPKYIRKEFEAYLACGIPAHGFLQVKCTGCGESGILAFSCKKRGFCPTCGARKMAEESAFLCEWVLPDSVDYRQYVLTVPIPLRFWMAKSGNLMTAVYRIFSQEVRRSIEMDTPAVSGTLTFIQRFGDGLRYHPHFHLLATEGGWRKSENPIAGLEFIASAPPGAQEVCGLLEKIQSKIVKLLTKRGLIKAEGQFESEEATPDSPDQLVLEMQGASTRNRFALSTPPGKTVRRERHSEVGLFGKIGESARITASSDRLAVLKGFSLHAGTSVSSRSGDPPDTPGTGALERLLRYMARNSTPLERLKAASGGDILIKLKRPWTDGSTHLRFSGVELVERLSSLIPPPRIHLIRFGGCFAPRHRLRSEVVKLAPSQVKNAAEPQPLVTEGAPESPQKKRYSLSWAQLLARVFQEDVTKCSHCGAKVKITAAILDRPAILRILTALDFPTEIPEFHPPARAPPINEFAQSEFSWAY